MPAREGFYKPGKQIEQAVLRLGNPKKMITDAAKKATDSAKKRIKNLK